MARTDMLQENMLRVAGRCSNWILPWDGIFGATQIRLDVKHKGLVHGSRWVYWPCRIHAEVGAHLQALGVHCLGMELRIPTDHHTCF